LYTIPTPGHVILPEKDQDKRLSWRKDAIFSRKKVNFLFFVAKKQLFYNHPFKHLQFAVYLLIAVGTGLWE